MIVDELTPGTKLLHPIPGNPDLYVQVAGRPVCGVVKGRKVVRVPVHVLLDHPIGLAEDSELHLTYDSGAPAPVSSGEIEHEIAVRYTVEGVVRVTAPSQTIAAEMAKSVNAGAIERPTTTMTVLRA